VRHLLLMRCVPDGLTAERRVLIENFYARMAEAVDGVNGVQIRYNCVARDQNMDVLVEMDIDGPGTLAAYLEHPLHQDFVRESKSFISAVVSFDCQ